MGHEKLDYAQERQATEATPWLQREKEVGQGDKDRPGDSYEALPSPLSLREKPTWVHQARAESGPPWTRLQTFPGNSRSL